MTENNNIKERVLKALERVRPYLQSDGGDIQLIELLRIILLGETSGCLSWLSV